MYEDEKQFLFGDKARAQLNERSTRGKDSK